MAFIRERERVKQAMIASSALGDRPEHLGVLIDSIMYIISWMEGRKVVREGRGRGAVLCSRWMLI